MPNEQKFECPAWLIARAQQVPPVRTAVIGAGAELVLQGVKSATEASLIEPVLVGSESEIREAAAGIGWDIADIEIHAADEDTAAVGVSLAREGRVAALMKGNVRTAELMRAAVDRTRGIRSKRRPSHIFHMTAPGHDKSLCITDAVINVLPKVRQKLEIAANAVDLMHALGNDKPNVALLSATEVPTAQMPSSIDAQEIAARAAAGEIVDANVAGPMALDVAVSSSAAEIKGVTNSVAGNADVLLVPNIEAGNILFKQMVHFMSATAAGIVVGLTVPIALTSRSDPPEARLASAALASIYAGHCDLT
ncbi:MAG: phosphate acetyltransferase [Woeseiaceae bacterium]|jgi:phosphate acetyltransferase